MTRAASVHQCRLTSTVFLINLILGVLDQCCKLLHLMKTTLETSGEDVKTTLETSGEDVKTTLETSGEDVKTTLETSVFSRIH
jgi:hypothetical protein